jgi:hypothetical protein
VIVAVLVGLECTIGSAARAAAGIRALAAGGGD